MHITSRAAVALTALLALTACGSSSSGGSETSGSTSPAVSDGVAWAGSVCQSADDLRASVEAIGASVSIDPGDGTALDQAAEQLAPRVEAVKGDVADLAGAVADLPTGSDPALVTAGESLSAAQGALQASTDALTASVQTFQGAEGAANRLTAWAGVTASFATVKTDSATFVTALTAVGTSAEAAVKDAFAQAPECSAYTD